MLYKKNSLKENDNKFKQLLSDHSNKDVVIAYLKSANNDFSNTTEELKESLKVQSNNLSKYQQFVNEILKQFNIQIKSDHMTSELINSVVMKIEEELNEKTSLIAKLQIEKAELERYKEDHQLNIGNTFLEEPISSEKQIQIPENGEEDHLSQMGSYYLQENREMNIIEELKCKLKESGIEETSLINDDSANLDLSEGKGESLINFQKIRSSFTKLEIP